MPLLANRRIRIETDVITRIKRVLSGRSTINVNINQEVSPHDILGISEVTSGYRNINLPTDLETSPGDVKKFLQKQVGQTVYKGELIALKPAGLLSDQMVVISPSDSVIDSFDEKTGQLLLWNEKTGTSKVVKPGGYVPVPPVPTETEKNKALKKQAITLARPALEASKRGGEFIDGNEFLRLRNDWAEAIGDTSDFDEIFGPQLSPTDRAKYGIGKATGVKAVEEITNGVKAVEEITNPFE